MFYNGACGIADDETVLFERFDSNSMGDGWDDKYTCPADVIDWLECEFDHILNAPAEEPEL